MKIKFIKIKSLIYSILIILVTSHQPIYGFDILKIVSPGKLNPAHETNNMKCIQCHNLHGERPDSKCLVCHTKIKQDRENKRGFHGRKDRLTKHCDECHKEHRGREEFIHPIDTKKFNHNEETGFPLLGFHGKLKCQKCHNPKTFRLDKSRCIDCHKDFHKGSMGNKCEICHSPSIRFKETKINHSKFSDIPLTGKHSKLSCNDCHKSKKKKISLKFSHTSCYQCHSKDDAHKGVLDKNCEKCHAPIGWDKANYDHSFFPLKGAHSKLNCIDCHSIVKPLRTGKITCYACHKKDDPHSKKHGEDCGLCHSTKTFRLSFDHFKRTGFRLEGKHKSLDCSKCHFKKGKFIKDLSRSCYDCHKNDDKHKLRFGKNCNQCHSITKWSINSFNHYKETGFALRGVHKTLDCEDCHGKNFSKNIDDNCTTCHTAPSTHISPIERDCSICHNENSFSVQYFSHSKNRLIYMGKHLTLECTKCHVSHNFNLAGSQCADCHSKNKPSDSLHITYATGKDCSECHNPITWKNASFKIHNTFSTKLLGKHADLSCSDCHYYDWSLKINPSYTSCARCHYKDYKPNEEEHHGLPQDNNCAQCHSYDRFGD